MVITPSGSVYHVSSQESSLISCCMAKHTEIAASKGGMNSIVRMEQP